jgi:hypothetical protein
MRADTMSPTDTNMADGAMGIMWRRDAVSNIATTIATTIAAAVAHPRTVRRQPAVQLLRCRMVRGAAAADRTHSRLGYGRRFKV